MPLPSLQVLYEDNHLLAVLKPAMVPTMGAPEGGASLLAMARQYVRNKYRKQGAVYLGIVSRLDSPVTGVVLIARTSKAAARLTDAFASRSVEKKYWAIVEGDIQPPTGECEDWLRKDDRHRRVHVTVPRARGAQLARLAYRKLKSLSGSSLVEIDLETGRKHQIRVQLSSRGFPILGDEKYGARRGFATGIALHARRLALIHPVRGTRLELVAPLPGAWRALGIRDEAAVQGPGGSPPVSGMTDESGPVEPGKKHSRSSKPGSRPAGCSGRKSRGDRNRPKGSGGGKGGRHR